MYLFVYLHIMSGLHTCHVCIYVCVRVRTMCVQCPQTKKMAPDLPKLTLQMILSCHMGAKYWTRVLSKGFECKISEPSFQPLTQFFLMKSTTASSLWLNNVARDVSISVWDTEPLPLLMWTWHSRQLTLETFCTILRTGLETGLVRAIVMQC